MNNKDVISRKILIADDDDDSRLMLKFILENEGWQVVEARDGKEALEMVWAEQPQVLILDNRMPELTGTEVYQCIQAQGLSLPVILATAYAELKEFALSLGISYFISKPFDMAELLCKVNAAYIHSS
uniref:Response regulator receiver protein n=1 Tax=Cyanothece sp. (strain PCC 7425 / ATCC 29141) TaxID=395961 RepID=B8HRC6_CYAP4